MVLVDSSIWIEHLRTKNSELVRLLEEDQILSHPFIIGELACGSLKNRKLFLEYLSLIPSLSIESHDDVLHTLESYSLFAKGIGWIDAHLLCAAVTKNVKLWSLDKKLKQCSKALGVNF